MESSSKIAHGISKFALQLNVASTLLHAVCQVNLGCFWLIEQK